MIAAAVQLIDTVYFCRFRVHYLCLLLFVVIKMTLSNIESVHEFYEFVKEPSLSVIHFYTDWAAQCGQMNDVMEELAKQADYKSVKFAKCLAEEVPDVSLKFNVSAVPTFILLRNGESVARVDGANAGELTKKIKEALSKQSSTPKPKSVSLPTEDLNTRLKSLINSKSVMLFMKGNAKEPRCGFSRKIVDILNSVNVEYGTFDILNDEKVRQGLKEFSKWPTYPQLYVNGELVGGLDIVQEMLENGELQDMLPKKLSLDERLKSLINKAPVMVFMKGNRDTPKCGFSRTLMEIMRDTGVPFETFDILQDEEVRQGLKEFSNWPTYPQVYVKGELVGGLDIVKELKESGDLLSTLKVV